MKTKVFKLLKPHICQVTKQCLKIYRGRAINFQSFSVAVTKKIKEITHAGFEVLTAATMKSSSAV
jgi:hypothetical protein